MIASTLKQIKDELKYKEKEELIELCLALARFKKDSKELLTYLLFVAHDEESYVSGVRAEISEEYMNINTSSIYLIKKSVRKILRLTHKYIRYSKRKETEVELLLHFCRELNDMGPSVRRSTQLNNLYLRQIQAAQKALKSLHEDLQNDYLAEIQSLKA